MSATISSELCQQVGELLNVGIALSAEKDHNRLLETILTEARKLTGADAGTLYLVENGALSFRIIQNDTMGIYQGGGGETIELPPVPMEMHNVSAYVAMTRELLNIENVYSSKLFDFTGPRRYDEMTGYRTCSMLVLPLVNHEDEVIGVLQLINAKDAESAVIPFASHLVKVVASLASQAAIALTNMQFMEDIEELFNSFVQVMATAVDAQTPYNANHTRRVAQLSELVAAAVDQWKGDDYWGHQQFDRDRTTQLVMAAWLHDIGKITTPLEVMNKATRLDKKAGEVRGRVELAKANARCRYFRDLFLAKDDTGRQQVKSRFKEDFSRLTKVGDDIDRADNPATFVDSEFAKGLAEIAKMTICCGSSHRQPLISPEELEELTIPRGTLTQRERQIIEDHVVMTKKMLEKMPFIKKLQDVPRYAAMHHELLDGKGYPNHLADGDIPAEGRILAMLDVFDALTASDRPYKKPMPAEKALNILQGMVEEGKLDGQLLEIFRASRVWESVAK